MLVLRLAPIVSSLILITSVAVALPEGATREEVWAGYLFEDERGDVRVGWPVIAMGVMERPADVLGEDLADQLKPFVSHTRDDYFFWNYEGLEAPKEAPPGSVDHMPRVLVQLRGIVTGYVDGQARTKPENRYLPSQLRRVMNPGKVETIEFLSEEWLRSWRDLFRLGPSPLWTITGYVRNEDAREMAPKALELLLRMKKHSKITPVIREAVARVDPSARPTARYQFSQECTVHRWLVEVNEKHDLNLKGIEDLGDVPPGPKELREWFLAANDKDSFFEKVRSQWKGDLGVFTLGYYFNKKHGRGRKTTYTKSVSLDDMLENWSDEDFVRHQASTKEKVERDERRRREREEKRKQDDHDRTLPNE